MKDLVNALHQIKIDLDNYALSLQRWVNRDENPYTQDRYGLNETGNEITHQLRVISAASSNLNDKMTYINTSWDQLDHKLERVSSISQQFSDREE
jgi:hypothetical protein